MNKTTYSVFLVDSQVLVRKAIGRLINSLGEFAVSQEASNSSEAFRLLDMSPTDLVVIELNLNGPSGVELLHELRRHNININSLVLSTSDSENMVKLALEAGARSFVSKSASINELHESLISTAKGQRYLPQNMLHLSSVETTPYSDKIGDPLSPLSVREREIFHLLASGLQNAVIAKKLFISPRTVETHRARVVRKLGLSSNAELIRFAIRHGLSVA